MDISAQDFARFCYLFLRKGKWNGKQLISEAWVNKATSARVAASVPSGGKAGPGVYGHNWWTNGVGPSGKKHWPSLPSGLFGAFGFNNNACYVILEWDMVITRPGTDGNTHSTKLNKMLSILGQAIVVD